MKTQSASLLGRIENFTLVRTVRNGLISMIPVLTIGAFALILKTFPVDAYQAFIASFAGGLLLQLFDVIYSATFGVLSVYMTYCISRAYMKEKADPDVIVFGAVLSSLLAFFILAGAYLPDFGPANMGPKSMFLAGIAGIGASSLYLALSRLLHRKYLLSSGVDREFNRMLASSLPIALTVLVFAILNVAVIRIFGVDSFRELIIYVFNALFSVGETGFVKGLFFVLLSSLLWFFGIHGSDTLEGVMETYFTPGLAANQAALAAGGEPTAILTKQFFDCFVLMGGCGAAICLLIAILLFSRSRARRGLGVSAALPMLFNINELMVFGLPIILNPVMLIPFLAVPLICYTVAYFALLTGLVPLITHEIAWTTPLLLGGYLATGSPAGAILQLVNVAIGVVVYAPFVRLLDKRSEDRGLQNYRNFLEFFRKNEAELSAANLIERRDVHGDFAKGLCADLKHGLKKQVVLAYQPQYHYDGRCIGVEALLRWQHPVYGMLYPPLVVKLAEDGGFLAELEEAVLLHALADRPAVLEKFGKDVKLSVNVTGTTVVTPRYLQFCRQLNEKTQFAGKNLCLEVTEQAAIAFNDDTLTTLRALREMGLLLAIDDFSMGQTSLNYLKNNLFDIIKLDGSLIRDLHENRTNREIIASITQLAESLQLTVLAEFVETAEQRETLHEIGCDVYQGYLYSPAVLLEQA